MAKRREEGRLGWWLVVERDKEQGSAQERERGRERASEREGEREGEGDCVWSRQKACH